MCVARTEQDDDLPHAQNDSDMTLNFHNTKWLNAGGPRLAASKTSQPAAASTWVHHRPDHSPSPPGERTGQVTVPLTDPLV